MVFSWNSSSSDDSFTGNAISQPKNKYSSESDKSFLHNVDNDSNRNRYNLEIEKKWNISYSVLNTQLAKEVAKLRHLNSVLSHEITVLKHGYVALHLDHAKLEKRHQTLQSVLTSNVPISTLEFGNVISALKIKENYEKSPLDIDAPVQPLRDTLKHRSCKLQEMCDHSKTPFRNINEETSGEKTILAANNVRIKSKRPRRSLLGQLFRKRFRNLINGEENALITGRGNISKQLDDSYSIENISTSDAMPTTPNKHPVTSNTESITDNETTKENKSIDQSNNSLRFRLKRKTSSSLSYVEPKLNIKMRRNT